MLSNSNGSFWVCATDIFFFRPSPSLQGKTKLFGFFVGKVMAASEGRANPMLTNDLLKLNLAP
jgi:hypothetical protein